MSIFGKISEAIFGRRAQPRGPETAQAGTTTGGAPAGTGTGAWWLQPTTGTAATAVSETDVEASLEARAAAHGERLNWRTSIVDLMKLLDIDSSLTNRKELAQELGFTGDTNDSATMNVWLHRQVMRELAANDGRVPAALTD